MMLPPPYFTVGIRCWCWCSEPFFSTVLCVPPKQLNFSFIGPQDILLLALWNIQLLFCELQMCSNVVLDSSGFFCGVLPWTPFLFSVLRIVDSSTEMLACYRDFCKSLADTLGFFSTSLSILRCVLAVSFAGWPLLGRVATVLNFLNLETICLTVDWWTSRLLEILM
jgi:hypothetical protein